MVRPTSKTIWTTQQLAVTDEMLGAALQIDPCGEDIVMARLDLAAAIQWFERRTSLKLSISIVEECHSCFPAGCNPFRLHSQPVVSETDWANLLVQKTSDKTPCWMVNIIDSIETQLTTQPVEVCYQSCDGGEPVTACVETSLVTCEVPATITPSNASNYCEEWPCLNNCDCDQKPITIRYLAGYLNSCELQAKEPLAIKTILMMVRYMYEQPETITYGTATNVLNDVLEPFLRISRWSVV